MPIILRSQISSMHFLKYRFPTAGLGFEGWIFVRHEELFIVYLLYREEDTTHHRPPHTAHHQVPTVIYPPISAEQTYLPTIYRTTDTMKSFSNRALSLLMLAASCSAFSLNASPCTSSARSSHHVLHATRDIIKMPTSTPMVPYKVSLFLFC